MGLLVRGYQQLAGEHVNVISPGYLWEGEIWFAAFPSFSLAWAFGLGAAWLERRRDWNIAAFFRGAIVGLGIASVMATIGHAAWGGAEPSSVLIGDRMILVVCLVLGGRIGLSRLKSS
jgi:hypothetical protein